MQKEDSNFLLYENHSIMNTKIRITGRWSESSGIHDDIGAKSGFLILERADRRFKVFSAKRRVTSQARRGL